MLFRSGLGSAQNPDWLTGRRLGASLSIGNLDAWGTPVKLDQAKLLWDGTMLRFEDISARAGSGRVTGRIAVSLDKDGPKYRFEGKASGVPIQGVKQDFSGVLEASGAPRDVPSNIHKGE